jgi:hypothetical protein
VESSGSVVKFVIPCARAYEAVEGLILL